jgi:hypothetical protein
MRDTKAPLVPAPLKGQRVADIGSPHAHGTVVTSGPYVSEVQWDAPYDKERGRIQYVTNDYLVSVVKTAQPVD